MSTTRLDFFSDGVFAIAITLLVVEIHPPDGGDLAGGLLALWPSYLGFVISFLLIGLVWANHHAMFLHIRSADRTLMFLNTLLLMTVAFIPFTAAVLSDAIAAGHDLGIAVATYGLNLTLGGVFFNIVWQYARHHPALLTPHTDEATARRMGHRFLIGPATYGAGTIIGYWAPVVGLSLFALLILFFWLPASPRERNPQPSPASTDMEGARA